MKPQRVEALQPRNPPSPKGALATLAHSRDPHTFRRVLCTLCGDSPESGVDMKYYDLLGLKPGASAAEIKSAYRKMAKQYHPDRNPGDPNAEDKFKSISEAYAVLSNEEKRRQYDQFGDAGFAQSGFKEDVFAGVDFDSIFREMGFGGFSFDSFGGFHQDPRSRRRRSAPGGFHPGFGGQPSFDAEHEISVGFMDAYQGGERQIHLRLSTGDEVNARIKIPQGLKDGTKLRLRGQGARDPAGRRGDLYLTVRIMSHPVFERSGEDINTVVDVPFSVLILGGWVDVETPEGLKRTRIHPGVKPDMRIRLRGLGFAKPGTSEKGDLYARVRVKIPEHVSEGELHSEVRAALSTLQMHGF
jgi:curved DNA-binding protein